MKKTLFAILFLTVSFFSFSQEFEIVQSEIFKDKKKNSALAFTLDDSNGGIITIRKYFGGIAKLKGYYIQHFDKNLKLINEYDYIVKKNRIEGAYIKNNKLHLIEFNPNKEKESITYSVKTSNVGEFNFESKELLKLSKDNIKEYFGIVVFPFFINNGIKQADKNHLGEVVMSEKNNFFAINFDIKNKDQETHKIFVYNDNLNLVYDKFITKDIKDRYFDYKNIEISDEDGTVFFLGKSFEGESRKKKKKGKTNYHFELTKINKHDQKTISFKEPEKFIGTLSLVKKNNQLSCIGFYGDQNESKYNGVAVYKLNTKSLNVKTKKFNPFSQKFMTEKYGDNEARKERRSKKGLLNIDFRSIEIIENGDLVVNAEEYYVTTHTASNGNGGFYTYYVYHFDDIISLRINTKGDLVWAKNINKAQTGFKNSSFTPISLGETTSLFINCADKIKKKDDGRIIFGATTAKKSNLYCIKVNNDGSMDYEKLIDDKDSKVFYKVSNGIVTDKKDEIIFLGKKKKDSQILKIKVVN